MDVIRKLLNRECQKSVTRIASEKFFRLHFWGRDRMPEMLLVISLGSLKAITTAMYKGNNMVASPRIKRTVTGQLTRWDTFFSFITAAPPFSRKMSSVRWKG